LKKLDELCPGLLAQERLRSAGDATPERINVVSTLDGKFHQLELGFDVNRVKHKQTVSRKRHVIEHTLFG